MLSMLSTLSMMRTMTMLAMLSMLAAAGDAHLGGEELVYELQRRLEVERAEVAGEEAPEGRDGRHDACALPREHVHQHVRLEPKHAHVLREHARHRGLLDVGRRALRQAPRRKPLHRVGPPLLV